MPEDHTLPTDTPEANARQERCAEVSPFSEPPSGVLGPQRARRVPGIGAETGNLQATAAMMILTVPYTQYHPSTSAPYAHPPVPHPQPQQSATAVLGSAAATTGPPVAAPPGALGPSSVSWSTLTVPVPVPAPAPAARAHASAATSSTANTDDPLCSGPGYDLWAAKALPRRIEEAR
ncbi:BQ5605_C008g04995 [Microbotryum silenes-dioicae]|uniref:BQ5605_C008g04995 protein n=1 Tax=Microbotryum silenes-dioicae TaxID=796604 RepID=A0A2X0MYU0_9BASI|nr:BQ5605_C008g04995 [Microbotryum silenes-dioicae]